MFTAPGCFIILYTADHGIPVDGVLNGGIIKEPLLLQRVALQTQL